MKTKIISIIFLFIWSAGILNAQTENKAKTFAEIKAEKQAEVLLKISNSGSTIEQEQQEEGSEYNEFLKWVDYWEPRLGAQGTFEDYYRSLRKSYDEGRLNPSRNRSYGNADAWKELGPYAIPSGGVTDLTNVSGCQPGIGPVNFLSFYRPDPDKILCSSFTAGLFYTSDKGVNWTNAGSDGWAHSGCRSACFSPNDPLTWYACAALGNGTMGYAGVYRTSNGGTSYTLIADYNTFPSQTQTILNKILIDPSNAATGFVATSDGLYKSTNINTVSVTWSLIKSGNVTDIEFKPGNSNFIYAAIKGSSNWTIEYTTNQGTSWSASPVYSVSTGTTANVTIEVTEANNDLLYYLSVSNSWTGSLYCYTYSTNTSAFKSSATDHARGQGNGFGVSNFNASTVYTNVSTTQFQKSTNGGTSWTTINSGSSSTPYHHDVEYITTPPTTCASCSTDVWICTHGGVSFSSNGCTNVAARMQGLGVAEVETSSLSTSQTNAEKIALGLYHDATVLSDGSYSGSWIPSWEPVYTGDGQMPLIDYSDPDYVWASSQGSSAHVLSSSGGHAYTYNVSTNFPSVGTWAKFLTQNPVYPNYVYNYVYSGNHYEIYRSNDRGKSTGTFEQISDFQNVNGIGIDESPYPEMVVQSPANANYMYVRLAGSQTYIMRTKTVMSAALTVKNSWESLPLPPLPSPAVASTTHIYSIIPDVTNPEILYIVYNGYWWPLSGHNIWKADYTNSLSPVFTDITGNFPSTGVCGIVAEKGSNGGLYIATDLGDVYYANNATINGSSTTWSVLGYGLPRLAASDMEINYASNRLRIATRGRGVWEHDLQCPSNLSLSYSGSQSGNQYDEAVNQVTSTAILASANTFTYRAGSYVQLSPGFKATPNSSNSFYAFIHPCSSVGNSPGLRDDEDAEPVLETEMVQNEPGIAVYPNPGTGLFTISAAGLASGTIEVYDILGNKVRSGELRNNAGDYKLDLSGYHKGIYLLSIYSDGQRYSKKIILE
ncbi:MAG: C-terminal target protein [Bacteroidetes bacterium]|nr:C-terminal target protein [Bacteroidota bacterium]